MSTQELTKMQQLANKWSPIIYHHPDEKYYPVSIDWLMANSILIDYSDLNNIQPISPITNQDIYNLAKKHNFEIKTDGSILFSFGSELYKGEKPTRNVPCYALIKNVGDKIHIIYIYLYAYNGEYPILNLLNAGQHPADIEHITLELDNKDDNKLIRVMYSAHGTKDGRWIPADKVPIEDGKIVAYMALNGHGLYPKEGIAFRLGGLANDYLAKGEKWEPKPQLIFLPDNPNFDINTMGWVAFNGRLGGELRPGNTDGIAPLLDKGWIRGTDILNESELKPPIIFSPTIGNILINIKNIIEFVIVYFITYKILQLNDQYLFSPKDGKYTWKEHLATIIIFILLFKIVKEISKKIAKRFIPS